MTLTPRGIMDVPAGSCSVARSASRISAVVGGYQIHSLAPFNRYFRPTSPPSGTAFHITQQRSRRTLASTGTAQLSNETRDGNTLSWTCPRAGSSVQGVLRPFSAFCGKSRHTMLAPNDYKGCISDTRVSGSLTCLPSPHRFEK